MKGTILVGGGNKRETIRLVGLVSRAVAENLGRDTAEAERLIEFVKDHSGYDRRQAIDHAKISDRLSWVPA